MRRHRPGRGGRALSLVVVLTLAGAGAAPASAYPPADAGYLDYGEMVAAIEELEGQAPGVVRLFSIGRSFEGRQLWAAKVSDNVGTDEPEPEVVVDAGIHGREHMTVVTAVTLLRRLVEAKAAGSGRLAQMVDGHEIYIVFNLNPDGSEYDHSSGTYRSWRKNRQPTPGSAEVGTDVNRNFGYRWGTNPLNASPGAPTYRGTSAWSTPEAAAFRDWVESRVVGGEQQLRVHITLHQYGRVVLYPYGYTAEATPADMSADDHDVLVTMADAMADASGYAASQSSTWAGINVGNQMDWMYGAHGVFTFTIEMGDAFYMGDEAIPAETTRALDAVYDAIERAACPYAVIGRAAAHCPPSWVVRLAGNDRFATAAAVSEATFDPGVAVAYVATGLNFPDALAAGVAAGTEGGPVLLVRPNAIPGSTATELDRLRPGRIVVVGGSSAVSDGVLSALREHTEGPVTRRAGADRYATAAAISGATFEPRVPVAFVATGANFPDGLAAVPAAVDAGGPLLLVRPDGVSDPTARELERLAPARIVVLGGPDVVSDQTVAELEDLTSGDVRRISGPDRYATAAAIASQHFADADVAYLATGLSFPDALSGGPAAARDGGPVLLVRPWRLEAATADRLGALEPSEIVVLGGSAAVHRDVAAAAAIAAR